MPKLDPMTFARPLPKVEAVSFFDPRFPDRIFHFTLKSLDMVDLSKAESLTNAFLAKYAKGFPAVDGRIIELTYPLVEKVAHVYVAQESSPDDTYTMEELLAMTITVPTVFGDLSNKVTQLCTESDLGKLVGVRVSQGQSSGTQNDTPE